MVVDIALSDAQVDLLFQALADRTRRDILERSLRSELSVSALSRHYDMSFAAVQKHVAVLERASLVTKERRGREQIVHTNGPTIARAIALLDHYEQQWISRAEQMADVLTAFEEGEQP
jgi:DNA-binding transcriptional ArsR family regulator